MKRIHLYVVITMSSLLFSCFPVVVNSLYPQSSRTISYQGMISYPQPPLRIVVGVDYWAGVSPDYFLNRDFPFLTKTCIKMVRLEFGPWSEANLRTLVPALTSKGISILGLLINQDLATNAEAWANWVRSTVIEFKGYVKVWEIWNEPNWKTGFQDDAAGYVEFLRRAYIMAKEADPTCTILGGSLLGTTDSTLNYLREMYACGAGNYMDALSTHPYCTPVSPFYPNTDEWGDGFWKLQSFRDVMVEYGDSAKRIWITEIGWPTKGDKSVSEVTQAIYLKEALGTANSWDWVEALIVFNWMDSSYPSLSCGINRESYDPPYSNESFCKPSFFIFEQPNFL